LLSPSLPGNKVENWADKMTVVFIGGFFILTGTARIIGVENNPVLDAITILLIIIVFALQGYSVFFK
jgi:hypothetical protein